MGPFGIKKATKMNSFLCLCLIVLATTANAGRNRPSGSGSSSAATTTTFDARSSPTGELAAYYEWDSLDPYYGHSDADMQYHYHAVPNGWSSANDPDACEHIGYMHDGGKLYGFCGDLDSCYVQNSSSDPTTESDYTYTNDA